MKMTQERALALMAEMKADRSTDFDAIRLSDKFEIAEIARREGYRAPKNANGSTARYFFAMVQRKAFPKTETVYRISLRRKEDGATWTTIHESKDPIEAKTFLKRARRQMPGATLSYSRRRVERVSE